MHGPITTAGKIDQFEMRFTKVSGAHFFIAANGQEAWPVSAAEAAEFKALYRRRMERARWIRRAVFLIPFGLMFMAMAGGPVPDWLGAWVLILYLPGIPLAFLQHALTSDLTRRGIERRLQRRITTRLPAAITPQLTGIGHFGRRLLIACVAVELGMIALHILMGEGALAEHMRVFHGQTVGNEGTLAVLTGTLAWVTQFALMLAILLLIVDCRVRRQRALAAEAKERADAPPGRPR